MWSGIVLLQNQITLLHKRDCNRTQDLIPIPYCGHIARNNNQLWFYPVSNASPDHNGATPKPIPFDNTGVGKAFSATSIHTTSTICAAAAAARGGHTRYWISVWFWFQDLGGSFWGVVPYMYRFVIIVKYLTNFFKLEWNLGIKFTLCFFFLSVYNTCQTKYETTLSVITHFFFV